MINKGPHLLALQFILSKMSKNATLKAASRTFPTNTAQKGKGLYLGLRSSASLRATFNPGSWEPCLSSLSWGFPSHAEARTA